MILTVVSILLLTPTLFAAEDDHCVYNFNDNVNNAFTNLDDCESECWIQVNGWCDWECDTIFDLQVDDAIVTYNDCMD